MLRNHLQPGDYTTDKPLIYAVLVETYFTLGRALMAEKKYVAYFFVILRTRLIILIIDIHSLSLLAVDTCILNNVS